MTIDLSQYLSAGYYVTHYASKGVNYSPSELLPDRLFSASPCIGRFIPDTWAVEGWSAPEERREYAQAFGIPAEALSELIRWVAERHDSAIGYPNVCFELETARAIVKRWLGKAAGLVLFGLGLHQSQVQQFLEATTPPPPKPGESPIGEPGVRTAVKRQEPMSAGGEVLGFEVLVQPETAPHVPPSDSWVCSLNDAMSRQLPARPNQHGFFDTFDEGLRMAQGLTRGTIAAERGRWFPWLIVRYPFTVHG